MMRFAASMPGDGETSSPADEREGIPSRDTPAEQKPAPHDAAGGITPNVAPSPELATLTALKADKAFMARVTARDPAALEHWARAHQAAYPEPGQEAPAAPGAFDQDHAELEHYLGAPITAEEAKAAISHPGVRQAAEAIGMSRSLLETLPEAISERAPGSFTREACLDTLSRKAGGDSQRLASMIEDIDRALDHAFDAAPELEDVFRHPALIYNPRILLKLADFGKALALRETR